MKIIFVEIIHEIVDRLLFTGARPPDMMKICLNFIIRERKKAKMIGGQRSDELL
jgi:hypothetical protein